MSKGKKKAHLKFDTSEKGLKTVVKPYMARIMAYMWGLADDNKSLARAGCSSGDLHRWLDKHGIDTDGNLNGKTVSRASVIFECNKLVELGYLDYHERSGKGGYHRVYELTMWPRQFANHIRSRMKKEVEDAFSERWLEAEAI